MNALFQNYSMIFNIFLLTKVSTYLLQTFVFQTRTPEIDRNLEAEENIGKRLNIKNKSKAV